jgi:hypothetical protein
MELPVVTASVGVQQGSDDRIRRLAGAQPWHSVYGIHWVNQRLGCQRTHATLDMDRKRADREEPRRDGSAQGFRTRIAGKD